MFRHLVRPLALVVATAGLSAGITAPSGAAPASSARATGAPAPIDCVSAEQALVAAQRALVTARAAVGERAGRVARVQRTLRQVTKRFEADPTPKHRARLTEVMAAKKRATTRLARAEQQRAGARAAVRLARAELAACRGGRPTLAGPVTGGTHGFPGTATTLDLATHDYAETEYFMSGTATAYERDGAWTSSGEWGVRASDTAPYRTRLLVRAPEEPADFNGTVLVEWLNVSGNSDADVAFPYMYEELVRQGYAWVGVSAQSVGVNSEGGASTVGASVMGLRNWDPARYGDLVHPGDAYSYDIFSKAGQALRSGAGVDPLPGMEVEHLIAAGQSQSAFRMITYANAVQPVADVYDALLIHARSGINAPLGDQATAPGPQGPAGPEAPSPVRVRTDLDVPVLQLVSETELFETGGGAPDTMFAAARQPDTELIRTWEMAGTAHSDRHLVAIMNAMYLRQFEGARDLSPVLGLVNDGPQRYLASAALRAMRTWIVDGVAPTSAEPIRTVDGAIVRDEYGNAVGGVRTPQVDVPTATISGETRLVPLNGFTTRFDAATLHTMYGSHAAYVARFTEAAAAAVAQGFLLPEDAAALVAAAEASTVGD